MERYERCRQTILDCAATLIIDGFKVDVLKKMNGQLKCENTNDDAGVFGARSLKVTKHKQCEFVDSSSQENRWEAYRSAGDYDTMPAITYALLVAFSNG